MHAELLLHDFRAFDCSPVFTPSSPCARAPCASSSSPSSLILASQRYQSVARSAVPRPPWTTDDHMECEGDTSPSLAASADTTAEASQSAYDVLNQGANGCAPSRCPCAPGLSRVKGHSFCASCCGACRSRLLALLESLAQYARPKGLSTSCASFWSRARWTLCRFAFLSPLFFFHEHLSHVAHTAVGRGISDLHRRSEPALGGASVLLCSPNLREL